METGVGATSVDQNCGCGCPLAPVAFRGQSAAMTDPTLDDVRADQHGVFTLRQAGCAGLSRRDIDFLIRGESWERLRRGVYAQQPGPDEEPNAVHLRVAAARLALKGHGVCSHETAATLYGWPLRRTHDDRVIMTMPSSRRSHRDFEGIHLHRASLPSAHVAVVANFATTSVARTLVDLGRGRSIGAALIPLDHALHHHLVTGEQLNAVRRDCQRWPGIKKAGEVVCFGDARAESPLESLGRLCLHRHDLPTPELQTEIVLPSGQQTRVDFYWEGAGVIGEADGLGKYTEPDVLRAEKLRQEQLEARGFVVVRFTWADIVLRPAHTAGRFRAAIARGSARTVAS